MDIHLPLPRPPLVYLLSCLEEYMKHIITESIVYSLEIMPKDCDSKLSYPTEEFLLWSWERGYVIWSTVNSFELTR